MGLIPYGTGQRTVRFDPLSNNKLFLYHLLPFSLLKSVVRNGSNQQGTR